MKPESSKGFQMNEGRTRRGVASGPQRDIRRAQEGASFPEINLGLILRYLLLSLGKIYIALKSHVFQLWRLPHHSWRLPWFKIALAGLAMFILTKKDLQFTINMNAPLAGMLSENRQTPEGAKAEQMSLIQPVRLSEGESSPGSPVRTVEELDPERVKAYVKRFQRVAQVEMQKFGIPASIKMAQGLVESRAGQSEGARLQNNHFGRPLGGDSYDSAWENWRAHSMLLHQQFRDQADKRQSYRKWAKILSDSGYSKTVNYGQTLLDVIEKYQLYLLDETAP